MCKARPEEEKQRVLELLGKEIRPVDISHITGIPESTIKRWREAAKPKELKSKPVGENMFQVTQMDGLEFKVEGGKPFRWSDSGFYKIWMTTTTPVNQILAKMRKDIEDGVDKYWCKA